MREHREVEGTLQRLAEEYDEAVFRALKLALTAHMRAEEASLFQAMSDDEPAMVEHAAEEHHGLDRMLARIGSSSEDSEALADRIDDLASVIYDHFLEEEEQMIPRARVVIERSRVRELSDRFDEVERIGQKAR